MSIRNHLSYFTIFISVIIYSPAFAGDKQDIDTSLKQVEKEHGVKIDKKTRNDIKRQVQSIISTKNSFIYMEVKRNCEEELKKFCKKENAVSDILDCVKSNSQKASDKCSRTINNEFGSEPLKKAQTYNGVPIPKGSTLHYYPDGIVNLAVINENIIFKGVEFKKGNIWLNESGIKTAHLANDSVINGIKYQAGRMAIFFDSDGKVMNAILAEDTKIGGYTFKGGTQLTLHTSLKRRTNTDISTHSTGVVQMGTLLGSTKATWFNEDGSIREDDFFYNGK